MFTITRRLEFDAGHRVFMHESKCAHVHGHRYVVEVECAPINDLDALGRVIDFSVLKSVCGKWLDDNLDHGMILFKDDPLAEVWTSGFDAYSAVEFQKHYLMDVNPTAENIAELLYRKFTELLSSHSIRILSVTVHETPNCQAKYGV